MLAENTMAGVRGNARGLSAMSTMQVEQHAARKAEVAARRGNASPPTTLDRASTMQVPTLTPGGAPEDTTLNLITTLAAQDDYRTGMQRRATAFITRHREEHLDDEALYERTVCHMVNTWDVPMFMADRLVHLAMSERVPDTHRFIPPRPLHSAAGPAAR